ncbi:MAG: mandelate racemase/muconate lactonizing enzyme family protein [Candidatus Latescibacterota bacterium]|nr:mandelate racemase/muconate lactonizing enzyme family protein [Candidatus Latescibacterota bacterium]
MKITDVRVFEVTGEMRSGLALYEIRRGGLEPNEVSPYRMRFTEVESDDGAVGLAVGGSQEVKAFGKNLIGRDPRAFERIWHELTNRPFGLDRGSRELSTLDVAIWDLLGKARGESVCTMLGGPVQDSIRAYAAMLGFLPEPEAAAHRAKEMVEQGFTGMKWYLPNNELAGPEGLKHNIELVRAVRDSVGPDIDIMADCILSGSEQNSLPFATRMAHAFQELDVTWLEEPLRPEDLGVYAQLRQATTTPISFGEHLKYRDQFVTALSQGIASVIQPEMHVVGGMTEMRKLVALSSSFGIPFVPHANESCRNAIHLSFANQKRACPIAEWGVKINHNVQHFFEDFYQPTDGYFPSPGGPGFGYKIDASKIETRTEI